RDMGARCALAASRYRDPLTPALSPGEREPEKRLGAPWKAPSGPLPPRGGGWGWGKTASGRPRAHGSPSPRPSPQGRGGRRRRLGAPWKAPSGPLPPRGGG